jgi:hypothetical protein
MRAYDGDMQPTAIATRSTHVTVESLAACPFSMAQEYAGEYLRAAEAHGPEASIGRPFLRHDVTLSFGIQSDVADDGRLHDELRVNWASGSRLLPDFRGSIRFRIDGERTRVLVDGSYAPPLGAFGVAFDLIAGRAIARSSVQDLADRVAAHLTRREAAWRRDHDASARQPAPEV